MFGGNSDPNAIGVYISYLERILDIIVNFFHKLMGGMGGSSSTDPSTAPSTEPETSAAPTTIVP